MLAMFPALAIRFAVVLTIVTSALMLPATRHMLERLDISHSLLALVYGSPQAMALAFPIAAFVAVVMHGIATRAQHQRSRVESFRLPSDWASHRSSLHSGSCQ